jgi:hypothetical protein
MLSCFVVMCSYVALILVCLNFGYCFKVFGDLELLANI